MQPFRIAAAFHHAPGELVDDDDRALAHDVVAVAQEQLVRAQRLVDVMHQRDVLDVVERAVFLDEPGLAHQLLHALVAALGEDDRAHLLVQLEMLGFELRNDAVHGVVKLGSVLDRAGNDERRARLVDEDRVHLVHDGEGMALKLFRPAPELHHVRDGIFHVVAEIVEAELVVRAIGDVAAIGGAALAVVEFVKDAADGEAEESVDLSHPLGVAPGEVVVHGHNMHAPARQRIEIGGQRRNQRLALAGFHLGDTAGMEHHAADKLHVEMALAQRPARGFPHGGKRLGQERVERLAVRQPLFELRGAPPQSIVRKGLNLRFEIVDRHDPRVEGLQLAVVGAAEDFCGQSAERNHALKPHCRVTGAVWECHGCLRPEYYKAGNSRRERYRTSSGRASAEIASWPRNKRRGEQCQREAGSSTVAKLAAWRLARENRGPPSPFSILRTPFPACPREQGTAAAHRPSNRNIGLSNTRAAS